MSWRVRADRAAGWLTTLPYRIDGKRVRLGSRLLGNGRLRIGGPGSVELGSDVNAWSHAEANRLLTTSASARIKIGNHVRLNGCTLIAADSIEVGDDCVLGSCEIRDRLPVLAWAGANYTPGAGPVILEDNVWVGGQVSILPGVRVGRNSVIGIHAVVVDTVPDNVIVAGNPARVIRALEPSADDNRKL